MPSSAEERLHPLAVAPYPDRLSALQQADGGWIVDSCSVSPAAALEWRGYATVAAVDVLSRNGRI